MRDVLQDIVGPWEAGESVGLATVVETWSSAPLPPGSAMVVAPDGAVTGSVSGGCVEGAVYELANQVLVGRRPVLQRYGVSGEDAAAVGLTCGGTMEVFVERVDRATFPELRSVAADIEAGRAVAVATLVAHPEPSRVGRRMVVRPDGAVSGSLGSDRMGAAVTSDVRGALAAGRTEMLTYGPEGERLETGARVFIASYAPPPRMIVFGAIDFAVALARMGKFLGYRVTVCDARALFATPQRFPEADDVVVEWPHRYLGAEVEAGAIDTRTVIAVLTHDPKFDVPLLEVALRLPEVGYVGAMGSRRTHRDRLARLRETGITEAELARLSSPLGLDLGARTPAETAVSIAAEIIALSWGEEGGRLTDSDGPIHRD